MAFRHDEFLMCEPFECGSVVEKVYGGQLRVSVNKSPEKGERRCSLIVSAELYKTTGSSFRKELVVWLTDENDPFFYYQLKLNDEDYQTLRVQQGLLVDFILFPQKFADLLELCRKDEMSDSPKFVLNFVVSGGDSIGHLNVIETNPFKHLVHLSLRLVAGSDLDVKKHLAQRLASLKNQNEKLRADLRSTESDLGQRLHDSRTSLSSHQTEVHNLKRELHDQATLLNAKWEQQLAKEQEKLSEAHDELQRRYERELRDCRSDNERSLRQIRDSLTQAESRASELKERCHGSESIIHDLRNRVTNLEDELDMTKRVLHDTRKERELLEGDRMDAETSLERLTARAAAVEQDASANESKAIHLRNLLDNAQSENKKLCEETERLQSVLTKRETSLKTIAEELNKGNEIIRKLQAEIKNWHSKFKLRNKVVHEQEKIVAEKDSALEKLQRELNTCKEESRTHVDDMKKLQDSLDSAQLKLNENAKLMQTNENVINWLNKQLNECQVDRQRGSSAAIAGVPFGSPFTSTPAEQAILPSAILQSRPIVQYQPSQASVQVQMHNKRSAFDAIPEDPNSPRIGKENNSPVGIDPKYLQPSRTDTNQRTRVATTSNVRLPRMSVAPPNGKSYNAIWPPKPSAYFPS